jgi:hypothetical protein
MSFHTHQNDKIKMVDNLKCWSNKFHILGVGMKLPEPFCREIFLYCPHELAISLPRMSPGETNPKMRTDVLTSVQFREWIWWGTV